jgi:hypothetical protein
MTCSQSYGIAPWVALARLAHGRAQVTAAPNCATE